ncbi:MAG: hypothetical protein GF313_01820 [Caldithrix sp.]|nr:hypothetical protein [Caldithrix sp.]
MAWPSLEEKMSAPQQVAYISVFFRVGVADGEKIGAQKIGYGRCVQFVIFLLLPAIALI